MAGEWNTVCLKTIATVKSGKRLPHGHTLTEWRTSHPYVRLVDIYNNRISNESILYLTEETQKLISRYILRKGDVCLAIVGNTIGLVFKVDEIWDGANLTENAARLTNFRGAESEFVFYYLRSQAGQELIKSRTVGSAQGKLPLYAIADLPIPLPPLPEQKRIAHILGTLDDKIELNRRMNKTLEEMARALFKSWFIDFDPVVAKSEGRQPEGMDAATAKLFPDSFEGSELGLIPKGWKVGKLSDIAVITMGQSPQGETFNEDGNGIVFYQGRAEFGWRYPTRRLFTTEPKRMAQSNDILMSVRAPVGDINLANEDCCIGRGLSAIRSKNGQASFMLYAMESLKEQLDVYDGEGTVFGCINKDALGGLKVLMPSDEAVNLFENKARHLDKMIFTNSMKSRNLATLRDTLLPKLINRKEL